MYQIVLLLLSLLSLCKGQTLYEICAIQFEPNCQLCVGVTWDGLACRWCSNLDAMDGSPGRCTSFDEVGDGDCTGFGASPGMLTTCDATASPENLNDPCALHGHDICQCVAEEGCGYCGESGSGQCVTGTESGPAIGLSCPVVVGGWTFEPSSPLTECQEDTTSSSGEETQVIPSDSISFDFNTQFKNLFINRDTLDVTMTIDTAVHWDADDVWSIMIRLGEGGYPSIGIPLNSTSISSRVDAPSVLPSYPSWQQYFSDSLNFYHDFNGLNESQDAFQALNPHGIVTNVSYVYDEDNDRNVIRWFVSFNLAYVSGHYNETNGCICTRYAILQRTECVVPISAVYRNSMDVSTWTFSRLRFVIFDHVQVIGVISSTIAHGFMAYLNSISSSNEGCGTTTDARLHVTYRLEYSEIDTDAIAGPMSVDDISFLDNCYALETTNVVSPSCANGICISYVTIQTECRTPTSDGLIFQQCEDEEDEDIVGFMSINVHAKQCIDDECVPVSAFGISDHVTAILLYSVYAEEVIDLHYDIFMNVLSFPNLTITESLASSEPSFGSDTLTETAVTITGEWFVPCLFMDSESTREIYDLVIDIQNITVWGLDRVTLNVNDGPFNWTDIQSIVTYYPKALDGIPVSCEGLPGCDCFTIPSLSLLQAMPSSTVFRIQAFASFTPVGVHPISGRRLLSHSSNNGGGFRTVVIYYGTDHSHWTGWLFLLVVVIPILFLFFILPIPVVRYVKRRKGYRPVSTNTPI
jgi:hypothetical protein